MSEHDRPVVGVVVPASDTPTGSGERGASRAADIAFAKTEAERARERAGSPPRHDPPDALARERLAEADRCGFCGDTEHDDAGPTYTFSITRRIEGLNARLVNSGQIRFEYAKTRNAWALELEAAKRMYEIPVATGPRRLILIRYVAAPPPSKRALGRDTAKLFDHANLVGGCKPIVDALVLAKLLVDDDPKSLREHYKQVISDFASDFDKVEFRLTDLVRP